MSTGKTVASLVAAVATILAGAVKCTNPDQGGKPTKVTVRLQSGSVLGKANWGMWKADADANPDCRWTVTKDGKIAASGGAHDAVISGHGIQGGVLHATNCGYFYE